MKNSTLIIAVIFGVALLGAVVLVLLPAPPATAAETQVASSPQEKERVIRSNYDFGDAATSGPQVTTLSSAQGTSQNVGQAAPMTAKEKTIEQIHEAMSTYSAEGVPVLEPLLSSPDQEVRDEAIEALKQLGVPQASAALRNAARRTSNPDVRQAMLDAAEFADLPPLIAPPR